MTTLRLSIEQEGERWLAFAPARPGCFAAGAGWAEAERAMPAALARYEAWRRGHGDRAPSPPAPEDVVVDEVIREWRHPGEPDYTVNAFFAADAPALTAEDVDEALSLLAWTRADLGRALAGLDEAGWALAAADGRAIADIVDHIGRAEWWYLDRVGLAPSAELAPASPLERLNIAREQLFAVLPALEGVAGLVERRGELWSPRKLLRRALWHEREHTEEIQRLRATPAP